MMAVSRIGPISFYLRRQNVYVRKIIVFIAYCIFCLRVSGQNISISFSQPTPYQVVDSVITVEVYVTSTLSLFSLTANVGDRQAPLLFLERSRYRGFLSLVGLSQLTTLYVYVTAVDTAGNQKVVSQPFIYDHAPLLTVDSPLDWSVARPLLHVKARCASALGCSLNIRWKNSSDQIHAGYQVDTLLDLSAHEGSLGTVEIVASDNLFQASTATKQVYVEGSPYLKEMFAARDQIRDFNYHKLFVTNIVDIITGDTTPIPYQGVLGNGYYSNRITPYGALFSRQDSAGPPVLYDWNGGSLYSLGPLNGSGSLRVAGDHALWSNGDSLHLRDLRVPRDTIISNSAGNDVNDVAGNGMAVYWDKDYNIHRYAGGISTVLTNTNDGKWNTWPVTDGYNTVYRKSDPCCTNQQYSIHLFDGLSNTELSNMGTREARPGDNYQANSKYTAFTRPDSAGILQVWLRDTLGVSEQMTFASSDRYIDRLGSGGDMIVASQPAFVTATGRRYFINKDTRQVTDLCSTLGVAYYRDSDWYLVLGRMLYRLNVGAIPHPPPFPALAGMADSFCSNAGVQRCRLLNLPDTADGNVYSAALDAVPLVIGADSTVSIDISILVPGEHVLSVTYVNSLGSRSLSDTFTIIAADTPEVSLSSNIAIVVNLVEPLIFTAVDAGGGGTTPLYTFSSDREFSDLLQAEGSSQVLTLHPSTLRVGVNWIYVRMRTSDSCYTYQTDVDSVKVERSPVTWIIDPEFPGEPISFSPNPFESSFQVSGLHPGKMYWLVIRNALGQIVYQRELREAPVATVRPGLPDGGGYWISVYDRKKERIIGTKMMVRR